MEQFHEIRERAAGRQGLMSQRSVRIDVTAGLNAPGEARRQVTGSLRAWGYTEPRWLDAAAVIISELVTNAVQHGGGGDSVPITMMASGRSVLLSVAILGGLLVQFPIGWLSDRFGRRPLMLACAIAASGFALAITFFERDDFPVILALAFLFSSATAPFYALGVAQTNDYITPRDFIDMIPRDARFVDDLLPGDGLQSRTQIGPAFAIGVEELLIVSTNFQNSLGDTSE